MKIYKVFSVSLLSLFTSCALFDRPTEPEPIWKAVYGSWNTNYDYIKQSNLHASRSQKDATEEAKSHLSRFLPTSVGDFASALKSQNFQCHEFGGKTGCSYSKTRSPSSCVPSMRVIVDVSFTYRSGQYGNLESRISRDDIDVTAMIVYDLDHKEGVCLAL